MKRHRTGPGFFVRRRADFAVLGLYSLTAFLFIGVPLLESPGRSIVGVGADPPLFVWDLGWWPNAVLQGKNPFFSHAIWAPHGLNLAWTTSVPGISALLAPVTLLAGPIAALNVAVVLMPALAAWTGYFLCRYLTRAFWPSLVGGYLFGFSSDLMLHSGEAHLHLTGVFLVPLIPLVMLRFLNHELGRRALTFLLAVILAAQLLISTEMSLMLAVMIATTLPLAWLMARNRRPELASLISSTLAGYALAGVVASPFVYFVLSGFRSSAANPQDSYYADLLSYAWPAQPANYLLGSAYRGTLTGIGFHGGEAYLGLPVLLMGALFLVARRKSASSRFLASAFAVAVVFSLGPRAIVDGHRIVDLPWTLVHDLPGFDNVLPTRFAVFATLAAATASALWLESRRGGLARWVLPALAVLLLVPTLTVDAWAQHVTVPAFFTSARYRDCLDPGETILALPIANGEDNVWQAENGFRFDMAGGWFGDAFIPKSFFATPGITEVTDGLHLEAAQVGGVREFIAANHIDAVVVDPNEIQFFSGALNLIAKPINVGGVFLYNLSPTAPSCGNQ